MITRHKIAITDPTGFHMTAVMTDEEYNLFQQIMKEEGLPNNKAYLKMLQMMKTIDAEK